jgi:hypothetical protein
VLATNIVDKEFKKAGISAGGGVVKVSAPQGGLASRNSPYPCGSRKSTRIVAALYLEVDFSAFTILHFKKISFFTPNFLLQAVILKQHDTLRVSYIGSFFAAYREFLGVYFQDEFLN